MAIYFQVSDKEMPASSIAWWMAKVVLGFQQRAENAVTNIQPPFSSVNWANIECSDLPMDVTGVAARAAGSVNGALCE